MKRTSSSGPLERTSESSPHPPSLRRGGDGGHLALGQFEKDAPAPLLPLPTCARSQMAIVRVRTLSITESIVLAPSKTRTWPQDLASGVLLGAAGKPPGMVPPGVQVQDQLTLPERLLPLHRTCPACARLGQSLCLQPWTRPSGLAGPRPRSARPGGSPPAHGRPLELPPS